MTELTCNCRELPHSHLCIQGMADTRTPSPEGERIVERVAKEIRHGDYTAFETDNFYGDAIEWPLARHIARVAIAALSSEREALVGELYEAAKSAFCVLDAQEYPAVVKKLDAALAKAEASNVGG